MSTGHRRTKLRKRGRTRRKIRRKKRKTYRRMRRNRRKKRRAQFGGADPNIGPQPRVATGSEEETASVPSKLQEIKSLSDKMKHYLRLVNELRKKMRSIAGECSVQEEEEQVEDQEVEDQEVEDHEGKSSRAAFGSLRRRGGRRRK